MFKCQITGETSKPGEKLNRIVVKTRTKEYKNWDREAEEYWLSFGSEIVKELNATDRGLRLWNEMSEEERVSFVDSL